MRLKRVYLENCAESDAEFFGFKFDPEVGKYYTEEPDLSEEEYRQYQKDCWTDYCNQFNGVGCI